MFISALQVKQAMQLDVQGVRDALKAGGYEGNDITGVCFLGMNFCGQFVYQMKFVNHEDEEDSGNVYIEYTERFIQGGGVELVLIADF